MNKFVVNLKTGPSEAVTGLTYAIEDGWVRFYKANGEPTNAYPADRVVRVAALDETKEVWANAGEHIFTAEQSRKSAKGHSKWGLPGL